MRYLSLHHSNDASSSDLQGCMRRSRELKKNDNMKTYLPLPIPVDKPFPELNKKEAKNYFDWFLAHLDERADYLREKISSSLNISEEQLDYSLDSFKPIWKWFLQVAEISKTPPKILKQLEKSLSGQPRSFISHMLNQSSKELSVFTEYVLRDIGMYIGKTFILNFSSLKWTIKHAPKSYVHVNVPLIVGFVDDNEEYPKPFYPDMDPIDIARTPAMNLFDNTQSEADLYNLCMKWVQWIPDK